MGIQRAGRKKSQTDRLSGARFRIINEQFYTSLSSTVAQQIRQDPSIFKAYHDGFSDQVNKWAVNPLDIFITLAKLVLGLAHTHQCINHLVKQKAPLRTLSAFANKPFAPGADVLIADMGCGAGRFSMAVMETFEKSCPKERLNLTIRSFDLVSSAPHVEAANIIKTPLDKETTDIAIYCLSLMGTDHDNMLMEANRVLRLNGELWIAEVSSRLPSPASMFIKLVTTFGFHLYKSVDLNYFSVFTFIKKATLAIKPSFDKCGLLKPCLYKKR